MVGGLLPGLDLPQLDPGVVGRVAEHFPEQLLGGEVTARAGGQVSAPGQQPHGPVVDLLISGHGPPGGLAAFGEGGRVQDDEVVLPLLQPGQQVEHIGTHAVHHALQPVAGRIFPGAQNVYWTLALGVLAMAGLKRFEKENGLPGWQGLMWAGGCAALALAASTDYHAIGVLIICTLYLTRADRKRQCLAGALLFLFELTAPLAFVLVWFYNGQRGACSPLQKKAFYWFYPVHLLVLAGITNLML